MALYSIGQGDSRAADLEHSQVVSNRHMDTSGQKYCTDSGLS